MENMGVQKLTKELKKLNPHINIRSITDAYPATIIARCSDCSKLTLPAGYYFSDKNGLTNKHNTTSGLYENFIIMTEYEYLSKLA